jgi:hypothetical protein
MYFIHFEGKVNQWAWARGLHGDRSVGNATIHSPHLHGAWEQDPQ